jgi:hypothetical protein
MPSLRERQASWFSRHTRGGAPLIRLAGRMPSAIPEGTSATHLTPHFNNSVLHRSIIRKRVENARLARRQRLVKLRFSICWCSMKMSPPNCSVKMSSPHGDFHDEQKGSATRGARQGGPGRRDYNQEGPGFASERAIVQATQGASVNGLAGLVHRRRGEDPARRPLGMIHRSNTTPHGQATVSR